jgi:hypothetical protein
MRFVVKFSVAQMKFSRKVYPILKMGESMKLSIFILGLGILSGAVAFANHDGSDIPACAGVTDVCMKANVSAKDSKTGKEMHGYQPGEHKRDGEGLWVDCVAKLAQGKTVEGVTGVTQAAAKACLQAEKSAHGKKTKK